MFLPRYLVPRSRWLLSSVATTSTKRSIRGKVRLFSTASTFRQPERSSLSLRRIVQYGITGTLLGVGLYDYYIGAACLTRVSVVRFFRTAAAVVSIIAHYKTTDNEKWKQVHQRSAEKLLALARANKGVYIKLAQHVAAMDYLLPVEYVDTMRVLHSAAPHSAIADVLEVVKSELNIKSIAEAFTDFDPVPIGAASLAQVHFATLRESNQQVAVKVQHREVRDLCRSDLRTVELFCGLANGLFKDVKFDWLRDIMNETLPIELDFLHEGENAETAAKILNSGAEDHPCGSPLSRLFSISMFGSYEVEFHVPRIFWERTTQRVLVMERCEGCAIDDKKALNDQGVPSVIISKALGDLYGKLIFDTGFIHADPHPGNLLVKMVNCAPLHQEDYVLTMANTRPIRKIRVSVLDHGLYCKLSDEFREQYALMWQAMLKGNESQLQETAAYFGISHLSVLLACIISGRTQESIEQGVQKTQKTKDETELLKSRVPAYFAEITQVLQFIPKELLLILKTNDRIKAIQRTLGIDESLALLPLSRRSLDLTATRALRNSPNIFEKYQTLCSYYYNNATLAWYEYALCVRSLQASQEKI